MLGSTDQVKIFSLDLIHHGIHLIKTHNTCYNIRTDHKWWNTIGKSTINHKVSCIRDDCGMNSCNISHQIIETISGNFSGCVKVNTIKTLHNICMIWNFEIRNYRLTELFNLYIAAVIFSNRNRWINDVWNCHHNLCNLFRQFLLLCLKFAKTCCIGCNLCLNFLSFFLLSLCHQSTDLLGNFIFICTKLICLRLCCTSLCIQLDYFINEWKLVILKFLLNVFLYDFRILS